MCQARSSFSFFFLPSSLGHVLFPFISSTFFSHVKSRRFVFLLSYIPSLHCHPLLKKAAALHLPWLSWRPEQNTPCSRKAQSALYSLCCTLLSSGWLTSHSRPAFQASAVSLQTLNHLQLVTKLAHLSQIQPRIVPGFSAKLPTDQQNSKLIITA